MWWQAFCPWLHGYIECDSLCFVSRLSKPSSTDFRLHRIAAVVRVGGRTHTRSINILHDYRICMNDILLMCLCAPASYNLLTYLSKITELNVRYQTHQFWICIQWQAFCSTSSRTTTIQAHCISWASGLPLSLTIKSTANRISVSFACLDGNVRIVDMFSSRISTSKWSTYHFGNTSKFYAFCCHFNTDVAERDIPMNNLCMWAEMRKNFEYDMRQNWYEAELMCLVVRPCILKRITIAYSVYSLSATLF